MYIKALKVILSAKLTSQPFGRNMSSSEGSETALTSLTLLTRRENLACSQIIYIIRGCVFRLCRAATATILHRLSKSMCQNLREHQSFKSYFLSKAVNSTVWPVDELKQKHRDRTHLTRHFPLYKETFSKLLSSADSKERDRQCPRTIKVTQSLSTTQVTRLPSTGPTMSRISTTSYIGKSGWWSELG